MKAGMYYLVGLIAGFLCGWAVFVAWPMGNINENAWPILVGIILIFTFFLSASVISEKG